MYAVQGGSLQLIDAGRIKREPLSIAYSGSAKPSAIDRPTRGFDQCAVPGESGWRGRGVHQGTLAQRGHPFGGLDMADEEANAAGLLSRLQLLLHAMSASPSDVAVLELALAQAVAATGAGIGVLGTMGRRGFVDLTMMFGIGEGVRRCGALQVGSRYPLTDAIARERSIWLSSPSDIKDAYPAAGGMWGRAFAAVPLTVGLVPVGAIGVIHDAMGHDFTNTERVFLCAVADICATIVADPQAVWPGTTTGDRGHDPGE
jgi:hypothetical protein